MWAGSYTRLPFAVSRLEAAYLFTQGSWGLGRDDVSLDYGQGWEEALGVWKSFKGRDLKNWKLMPLVGRHSREEQMDDSRFVP